MNEQAWLTATEPGPWIQVLHSRGVLTDRKARLFGVAVCRRIWWLLRDERSRRAVELAEAFADGSVPVEELTAAYYAANVALLGIDPLDECYAAAASVASTVAYSYPLYGCACTFAAAKAVADTVADASENAVAYQTAQAEELVAHFGLLRDLAGNPFRRVSVGRSCLPLEALSLAQSIYQERDFTPERLAVLADTLARTTAINADLLDHLRGPGLHAGRGCWAVDAVLGRA
jgi:hypothetical protein